MSHHCPAQTELIDFSRGTLRNLRRQAQIETHLDRCASCLAIVESQPMPLVSSLREDFEPHAVLEEGCQEAMRRALEIPGDFKSNEAGSDFVKPVESLHDDRIGTVLGRFRIGACLGLGGMGVVYRAIDSDTGSHLALKLMHKYRVDSASSVARFQRELDVIRGLSHPNIVAAYDSGTIDDTHFLAMELIDGVDVAQMARRARPMDPGSACEIIRQAAVGLSYIHTNELIHRDLKPANLMLAQSDDGVIVKILDLGLARLDKERHDAASSADSLTSLSQIMGTIDFMSPEQCLDSHDVDVRSDIFSLGATLFRLLAGKSIWSVANHKSQGRKLRAILTDKIPSIGISCEDLDPGLVNIVDRMLMRDPDDRFQKPIDVVNALVTHADDQQLAKLCRQVSPAMPSYQDTMADSLQETNVDSIESPKQFRFAGLRLISIFVFCLFAFAWFAYLAPDKSRDASLAEPAMVVREPLSQELSVKEPSSREPEDVVKRLVSPSWEWSIPYNAGVVVNNAGSQTFASLSNNGLIMCLLDDESSLRLLSRDSLDASFVETDLHPRLAGVKYESPKISDNGLLLFYSAMVDGQMDVFVCKRASVQQRFGPPSVIVGGPNTNAADEMCPSIGDEAKTMLFVSSGKAASKGRNIWWYGRQSAVLRPLFSVNSDLDEMNPSLAKDGNTIFFNRYDKGKFAGAWLAVRDEPGGPYSPPVSVEIPGVPDCTTPFSFQGGNSLVFSSRRDGGHGEFDVWLSHRQRRTVLPLVQRPQPPLKADLTRGLLTWLSFDDASGDRVPSCVAGGTDGTATFAVQDRLVKGAPIAGNELAVRVKEKYDNVEIESQASMVNMDAMTLSIWIRVEPIVGGARPVIINRLQGQIGFHLKLVISDGSSGQLMFSTRSDGQRTKPLLSKSTVVDGEWHHVVVGCKGKSAAMYIDGELQDSKTRGKRILERNDFPLIIGNGDTRLEMDIDEFCFYDRALTEEELRLLSQWRPQLSAEAD